MKTFEDRFMNIQISMIKLCLEISGDNIDKVYAYGSIEKKSRSFNAFFVVDSEVKTLNMFGIDLETRREFLRLGAKDLELINDLCHESETPVPTELKLIYDHKQGKLDTLYKYEPVATGETGVDSSQVFMDWVNEIKLGLSVQEEDI